MEGGGSGSVALPLKKNNIKTGFQGWVCKQPLLVETAAVAATYALQGAVFGLFYGSLAQSAANDFLPFEEFGRTRLLQVPNFSVLRGTDGAMICAMRRIRGGKDDTKARAVAAFTSGFMFQVVSNIPSPITPEAIATGLLFAVCHGLAHEQQMEFLSSNAVGQHHQISVLVPKDVKDEHNFSINKESFNRRSSIIELNNCKIE
ncbi:hypothetical protein MKW92_023060 [Papaver armeniacum]|nr:hypothetical protein MKW92_023060 [Papaver armeniacum]